jgi:hypothetical protein
VPKPLYDIPLWVDTGPMPLPKAASRGRRNQTLAVRSNRDHYSALRYRPAPDRNAGLRERIVELAHRHRRYGAGMIYLKLRQAGERVNHKRADRLYALRRPPALSSGSL